MVNDNIDNKNNIITPNQNDMKDNAPLTMKDIARELGVSVATVSRALKDSPRISPERRALIQEYAREHNFISIFNFFSLRSKPDVEFIYLIE